MKHKNRFHLSQPSTALPILAKSVLIASLLTGCSSIAGRFNQAQYTNDYELAYMSDDQLRAQGSHWEQRFRKNPEDPVAAVGYSQHLRHLDEGNDAVKVMRIITIKHPQNPDVLKEYGKTLVQTGQFVTAAKIFERGRSPVNADWDLLNNMAISYDHIGDTGKSMELYKEALALRPGEPRILANIGMSHALSGNIAAAEHFLTQAVSHPHATNKIRENYALVQGIKSKVASNPQGLPTLSPSETASAVLSFMPKTKHGLHQAFTIID